MTVQNRETVGTIDCKVCNQTASVHQTARGKNKLLYRRCGCGCDQRTGAAIQKKWAQEMNPRQGYEHLKISEELEKEPVKTEVEPIEQEAQESSNNKGSGGLLPVFGAICGLGLLLLTAGGSSGGLS